MTTTITGNDYNRLQLLAFMLGTGRFQPDIDRPLVHARFRGVVLSAAYAVAQEILRSDPERLRLLLPEAVDHVVDPRITPALVRSLIRAAGVSP